MSRTIRATLLLWALFVAALSFVPVTAAQAQCPPGAYSGTIGSTDKVKIIGLSKDDAYFSDAAEIIGTSGRIEGAFSTGTCWYAGQFYGDNGDSWYFYQVALMVTGSGGSVGGGCPGTAYTGSAPTSGTRIKVLTVSPDDAYYSSRASYGLEGVSGRTDGSWSSTGSCWYAGQFYTDAGDSYYFYQAAIEILGAGSAATGGSCPAGAYTGGVPASGTKITVLTVSPEDAYYSSRSSYGLEGKTGRTDGSWLKTGEPCWYAGQFYADNGDSFYFYQAAFTTSGASGSPGTCPSTATTKSSIPGGARVTLIDLHPDDAYYSMKSTMIGLSGKVDGDLHSNDKCWMGGGFTADNGSYYYFYKAAFTEGSASAVSGGAKPHGIRFMGGSVADGARFVIVALHPDDAYYPDRATLKGKACRAVGNLPSQGPGWYSGQARCDDGTEPYFYKVGVSLE